jgi:predicted PurR-regulated permease PerM
MAQSNKSDRELGTSRAIEAEGGGPEARLAVLLGKRLYQMAGLLFVLALLLHFFEPISRVLLIAFVGAIVGIAFNGAVVRLPFSRGVGTAIVGLSTLAALGLSVWFMVTFVAGQLREFIADLPALTTMLESAEEWIRDTTGIEIELLGDNTQQLLGDAFSAAGGLAILGGALGLVELVAMTLLVLMGAFFVVANPNDRLLIPLLRAVPPESRPAYRRMLSRMGTRLSGWLVGTLVSMLMIGILSTVAFVVIGVPYSIMLGVLNALLSIIPLIGAWIGGAIAVLVMLFYDPGRVIFVALAVVAIQELEGNLVRPLVMAGAAQVHPFVTLLALLLFGSMFGILGAILSIPIVLLLATIVEVFWVEETLETGDDDIEPLVEK